MNRAPGPHDKTYPYGGSWFARLAVLLLAAAGLTTATALPLAEGARAPERDKAKAVEVAPASQTPAADLAAGNAPAPADRPSIGGSFFSKLLSILGAAMIGFAAAIGQPPDKPFRDRCDGPCEIVPGEDIGDDVTYIDFDNGELDDEDYT